MRSILPIQAVRRFGNPRPRFAMLVVPGIGASAEGPLPACPATSSEDRGVEPVIGLAPTSGR
jgi:hypothetical protein